MVAWLVTWEWTGEYARVDNNIVAVLRWRLSPNKVREITEILYATYQYTPTELMRYCGENNGKNNPYPARFHDINRIPWQAHIYCGHNPYLHARIVDNLRIFTNKNGEQELDWEERPIPEHLQRMMREGNRLPA